MKLSKFFTLSFEVCSLSEEKNKNSPGGVLETSASTIQLCEEKCKERENCKYGFDWNPSVPAGSQCYISVSDQRSDFPGVSHYTVVCQTGKYICLCIMNVK